MNPSAKLTLGGTSGNATTTFAIADHSGLDAATESVKITYTITGKLADGTAFTNTTTQSIGKSKAGADPKFVVVTGEQMFAYPANSTTPSNTAITLSASLFGGLTTYQWMYWNGTAWQTLGGTSTNPTYSLGYSSMVGESMRVACFSGVYFDELTIIKAKAGDKAIHGYLTNETASVPAASDGSGASASSVTGNFKVMLGTTDVTGGCTFSTTAAMAGVTSAINSAGAYSFSGAWSAGVDTIAFTFTATHTSSGTQLQKTMTLSKAKSGIQGVKGDATYTWFAYADDSSGITNFTTGVPAGHKYIGVAHNKSSTTESTTPSDYTWSLIKGADSVVPGPPGVDALTAVLSNDYQGIACDVNGNSPNFSGASTTMTVFYGLQNVTGSCSFSAAKSNCNCIEAATSNTQTVNGVSNETGSVTITATYAGQSVQKVFTWSKVRAGGTGASPTVYNLVCPSSAAQDSVGNWKTASLAYSATSQTGNGATSSWAGGIFKISVSGGALTTISGGSYSLPASPSSLMMYLYAADGTTLLDVQSIAIIKDGSNSVVAGPKGAATYKAFYKSSTYLALSPPNTTRVSALPSGGGVTWSFTPPALNSDEQLWVSTGTAADGSDTITWSTSYQDTLRVGSLSAITANVGSLTSAANGYRLTINEADNHEFRCFQAGNAYPLGGFAPAVSGNTTKYKGPYTPNVSYANNDLVAYLGGLFSYFDDGNPATSNWIPYSYTATTGYFRLFEANLHLVTGITSDPSKSYAGYVCQLPSVTAAQLPSNMKAVALKALASSTDVVELGRVAYYSPTRNSVRALYSKFSSNTIVAIGETIVDPATGTYTAESALSASGTLAPVTPTSTDITSYADICSTSRGSAIYAEAGAYSVAICTSAAAIEITGPVKLNGVVIATNAPVAGQILKALTSTTARWSDPPAGATIAAVTTFSGVASAGAVLIATSSTAAQWTLTPTFNGKVTVSASGQSAVFCNGTDAISANGNITASGNVTAYDGSDIRWKENVQPIRDPIRKLLRLSGNTVTWSDEYYSTQNAKYFKKEDVAVIAQEVAAVLPEAVHQQDDGYLRVAYQKLIPLLIEGFKAQQTEIDDLKSIIKELRDDISRNAL
jgi:hypothetical protein